MMFHLFTFVQENADICTVMLSEHGQMALMEKLKNLVIERSKFVWQEYFQKNISIEFEHYISFNFGGCVSMLQNWIRTGMKESPSDMTQLIETITRGNVAVFEVL